MVLHAAGTILSEVQKFVKAGVVECEECIFTASGQADTVEEPEAAETGTNPILHSLLPALFSALDASVYEAACKQPHHFGAPVSACYMHFCL